MRLLYYTLCVAQSSEFTNLSMGLLASIIQALSISILIECGLALPQESNVHSCFVEKRHF